MDRPMEATRLQMTTSNTSMTRRDALRLAAGVSAAIATPSILAQDATWPTRPVRIVLAIAAGSSGDSLARMLKPRLEAIWKQTVIVENRPGAGGIIGSEHVSKATDNHTLLMASHSSILPKFTKKDLGYDPLTDLQPVHKVINYQMILTVNEQTGRTVKTLQDLVALSRSSPNGIFFSGVGRTGSFNIAMAILNQQLGINYTALDFNSIGDMNLAVLRGDAQFVMNTPSAVKGHIGAGAMRAIAALSHERYPNLPDVPTVFEAGYKGYLPVLWAGLMAPKSMPTAVVDQVARDARAALVDPAFKTQIESNITGAVPQSSPAEFRKELIEETTAWAAVFKAMKFEPQ